MPKNNLVPVIDLFAGPGGLGEGFSALRKSDGTPYFRIALSVEKDKTAHATLLLRSFFRQFPKHEVPEHYYKLLRGKIKINTLYSKFPKQAALARKEAWNKELGSGQYFNRKLDRRISQIIERMDKWVLIGGPPCQPYSVAGRVRNKGIDGYKAEDDKRHFLYREYLRILAKHSPPVFIMENVKGILSSKVNGSSIFSQIIADLSAPPTSLVDRRKKQSEPTARYAIFSLVKKPKGTLISDAYNFQPSDFVIRSEEYGIPQARHRVILLGVRKDILETAPGIMSKGDGVSAGDTISGLPYLRSGLSTRNDSKDTWIASISQIAEEPWFEQVEKIAGEEVSKVILSTISNLRPPAADRGGEFVFCQPSIDEKLRAWCLDERIGGITNHAARAHIKADLYRYLYCSSFAKIKGYSPRLHEFPHALLPQHENAETGHFEDRFRVQLAEKPATTITSHISKDGHYYIHYNPAQCRSLTVRESARLQTFPDNYFFMGNRTAQYVQVGNAVPPLLALKIADVVKDFLESI